ncbi:TraR/DksA C4-type zinc finger protein [Sporosarcina sp. FA9]|uniref:TraR/DksA C4-type zinc finger protein n=1 Tax=Sporosarcina sp. FA9 TaxID=3413030 RepID=UPI003F65CBC0
MLSDRQRSSLKTELTELKAQLMTTKNESDIKESAQEESGELSMYANHPGDLGTELYDREKNMAINIHANTELDKVENALKALQDGSYGRCDECGNDIPFERLEAIPYTTVCMEHAIDTEVSNDRPVEEEILKPPFNNSFAKGRDGDIRDYQDSFKEAAQDGTSETPSDFIGDHDDYETLYENGVSKSITEDFESFSVTDITGKNVSVIESPDSEEYKDTLDKLGIESPLGDIPYHQKDSYLEE